MQVVVTLRADIIPQALGAEPAGDESRELAEAMAELGVEIRPLHPGAGDPTFQKYFVVNVADHGTAEAVADRLLACRAVESAYPKPEDALP